MSRLLASRRRVFFAALGLLLVLDVGRSIFARLGYADPTATWQPDPSVYADLTWPPGADLAADVPLGRRVYAQRCAVCHGPDGRGNGPAAPSLIPRPRDFTLGQFKYKSTGAGQPPSDADLIGVVANGLHASAMPYWRDILDSAAIRAVVDHVKSLSPVFQGAQAAPLSVPRRVPASGASVARGRALFTTKGCVACHGVDGRARLVVRDVKGYPVGSRDLTAPWTFRGGSEPEQLWLRLATGLAPGPMPSVAATTTPSERWDLVNYVRSLARVPPWSGGARSSGPARPATPCDAASTSCAPRCAACATQRSIARGSIGATISISPGGCGWGSTRTACTSAAISRPIERAVSARGRRSRSRTRSAPAGRRSACSIPTRCHGYSCTRSPKTTPWRLRAT